MTVHLNIWDQWAECHATARPCPRAVHLNVSLEEARSYPKHVLESLFAFDDRTPSTTTGGTKQWRDKAGKLHRDNDMPAVIRPDGAKEWWKNGQRHRESGPAIIDQRGEGRWFKNDVFYIVGGKRPAQEGDSLEQLIALSPRRKRQIEALRRKRKAE